MCLTVNKCKAIIWEKNIPKMAIKLTIILLLFTLYFNPNQSL